MLRRALTLYEFDTVLLPVNPAEPQHASFLPLAQEAMAKGMGVIAMKTLCRGQLPQMAEEPGELVKELLAYALSQSVTSGGGGGGLRRAGEGTGRGGAGFRAHDPGGGSTAWKRPWPPMPGS